LAGWFVLSICYAMGLRATQNDQVVGEKLAAASPFEG